MESIILSIKKLSPKETSNSMYHIEAKELDEERSTNLIPIWNDIILNSDSLKAALIKEIIVRYDELQNGNYLVRYKCRREILNGNFQIVQLG